MSLFNSPDLPQSLPPTHPTWTTQTNASANGASDTLTAEAPAPEEVTTPEAPEDAVEPMNYRCSACGQATFTSVQGLGSHMWAKHGLTSENNGLSTARKVAAIHKPKRMKATAPGALRVQCPVCGKSLHPTSMGRHADTQHPDVEREVVTPPRPKGRPPRQVNPLSEASLVPFDSAYDVDDIFNSVVGLLFPDSIPTTALAELMAWREQTKKLLDHLAGS